MRGTNAQKRGKSAPVSQNTTDATRGQPLAERVITRKNELEEALANFDDDGSAALTIQREALELAIASANQMLTGDLDNLSDPVSVDMNRWLEANKHLGNGDKRN
ncbi:MAG TPA: hypothetical protein VGM88_05220 [Kofleriaceae bacterium]|jgi:hypothetical protein